MLIAHPLSTCDICLDEYSFASAQSAPHVIPCGHIFCSSCLDRLQPRICPLCRTKFLREAVKRLHVDHAPHDPDGHKYSEPQIKKLLKLLQGLALSSGENASEEDLASVILDIKAWLEGKSMDTVPDRAPHQKAVNTAHRHKRHDTEKRKRKEERRMLRHAYIQDIQIAQAVEQSLRDQLQKEEEKSRMLRQKYLEKIGKYDQDVKIAQAVEKNLRKMIQREEEELRRLQRRYDTHIMMAQTVEQSLREQLQNADSQYRCNCSTCLRGSGRERVLSVNSQVETNPPLQGTKTETKVELKTNGQVTSPKVLSCKGSGVDRSGVKRASLESSNASTEKIDAAGRKNMMCICPICVRTSGSLRKQ